MRTLEQSIESVLAAVPPPRSERVTLAGAGGRIVAQRIKARVNLPHFDNSAMDGYAVRLADVLMASPQKPVRLKISGRLAAGAWSPGLCLEAGQTIRVFTGSPLPVGTDAVVMQEDTAIDPSEPETVLVKSSAEPGENIRRAGEDLAIGTVIAEPGVKIGPARISLLAANGIDSIEVGVRPVVGLLATGSELVEPGQPLNPGCIHESTRPAIAEFVTRAGGIPRAFPIVQDDLAATIAALKQAFEECDIVVTCGGVSVGELDFVKQAFEAIGGEIDFWRIAMKPGRPFVFGKLGGKLLSGLPGNPVSAFVTFLLLVWPVIRSWQGAMEAQLSKSWGRLLEPVDNPDQRRHFLRVHLNGRGEVSLAGLQASHALASLAVSNGLLDVPAGTVLAANSLVPVLRWDD